MKQLDLSDVDECTSDCDSCLSSQASTDPYDHKLFKTFAHKVHSILTTIFLDDLHIQVERLIRKQEMTTVIPTKLLEVT
jgi:hypothetical protein